jgi:hypothetical protein
MDDYDLGKRHGIARKENQYPANNSYVAGYTVGVNTVTPNQIMHMAVTIGMMRYALERTQTLLNDPDASAFDADLVLNLIEKALK